MKNKNISTSANSKLNALLQKKTNASKQQSSAHPSSTKSQSSAHPSSTKSQSSAKSAVSTPSVPMIALEIEKAIYGGQFLAKNEQGKTYLLDGVATIGETVDVQIKEDKKQYAFGQILPKSTENTEKMLDLCPQLEICGGCPWQKLSLDTQIQALERDIFHQIKTVIRQVYQSNAEQEIKLIDFAPTETFETSHWRSTARLHWGSENPNQNNAKTILGFHQQQQGHKLFALESCQQLIPILDQILQFVKSDCLALLKGKGTIRISASPDHQSGTLFFEEEQNQKTAIDQKYQKFKSKSPQASIFTSELAALFEKIVQTPNHCVQGIEWRTPDQERKTWGKTYNLYANIPHEASSFVQAHQFGNQALIKAVLESCQQAKGIIEIYAGSGNFTIPLAEQLKKRRLGLAQNQNQNHKSGYDITAFEWDQFAVDQLRKIAYERDLNLHIAGIKDEGINEKIFAQDDFDHLLMDPPRAGAIEIIQKFKNLKTRSISNRIKKITYVSCHASAMCRDLKELLALGEWRIERVKLFHLFPHSGHIEVFCEIVRKSGKR